MDAIPSYKKKAVSISVCTIFLIILFGLKTRTPAANLEIPSLFNPVTELEAQSPPHTISDRALYFGAGLALNPVSHLAKVGWGMSLIFPWASTLGNECFLLSHLCSSAAERVLNQLLNETPSKTAPSFRGIRTTHFSWHLNQRLLSQIPASSIENKQLIDFLQKRWLAKATGFYPLMVDLICPCFGISLQVHPETTSSYARNPSNKFSETYTNIVKNWKRSLPHPLHFPLLLTRPFDVQEYLPSCLSFSENETIQTAVDSLRLKMQSVETKVVVDLTQVLPEVKDSKEWLHHWKEYRTQFCRKCKEYNLNINQIICIQTIRQKEIGGIRILPLTSSLTDETDRHHQFLLEWVSGFGLTANRIELDRYPLTSTISNFKHHFPAISLKFQSKDDFLLGLNMWQQNWKPNPLFQNILLDGTFQALKGLFANISETKWNEISHCPTRSSITQLSFLRINEHLKTLAQKNDKILFFDTMEQIHADLSSLLEIFAPFSAKDFPAIYKNLLSIPASLKPLTSCAVHSSGMTSLAGIFKAVERTVNTKPHILYGENTYFECINAAHLISNACSIDDATDENWREVDLILAQFNPALRRVDFEISEYRVEKIAEALHKRFHFRKDKPLTLALDCTLDFIDSPRVSQLLTEFQTEIETGVLNIICYRSGIKFDLFGMDNYCGAPFFMVHNHETKWLPFDSLLADSALQTDRLSLNWFCLAYKCAANPLERYRKQIFDNTRALLNKVPSRLLNNKNVDYRIIPMHEEADTAFIDIKIFGPLHEIRGGVLAGGCLYLKCLEGGQPIFYRPTLGLYHPNFSMIFYKDFTTIRLTLGLDPAQVDVLAKCFEMIDALNGSSWKTLKQRLNLKRDLELEDNFTEKTCMIR